MLGWFTKRAGGTIRMGSRSHGIVVLDTVSELKLALGNMAEGRIDAAMKCIDRLFMNEHEADRIEERLCVEITGGDLSVHEREDQIHFVRKVDQIANWAKEAGIYIQLIIETGTGVTPDLWRANEDMADEVMTAVKYLIKAIESLDSNTKETLRNVDDINDQEAVVDTLYFQTIKHIHLSDLDAKAVLLVSEVTGSLEMAADVCKSCGDTIMIQLTSRRA
jgi:uncharacterized protein Yka (UPF0111/DUF47 family)